MHSFDLEAIRPEFPVTGRMLYFDSAFQTPMAKSVRDRLFAFYEEAHVNAGPKSVWLQRLARVRARLAELLGAQPEDIAFTKNTSEGLNIAAHALPWNAGDNVLLVDGEHPNNAYAWLNLRSKGLDVRIVPSQKPWADADTFRAHVDDRTRAISLSHVMFHSGQRNDLESVSNLCRERGIRLVVDAMQSAGVLPLHPGPLGISMLAAGAHKGLFATHGVGVLYCPANLAMTLQPAYCSLAGIAHPPDDLVIGSGFLELTQSAQRFELGNFNHAGIHALSASLDLILGIGVEQIAEHVLRLGDRLIAHLDDLGVRLVGPRERERRAHIYVLDLPGQGWLEYLAANEVRVSRVRGGIRVSFALFNTEDEVDRLAEIVKRGLRRSSSDGVLAHAD